MKPKHCKIVERGGGGGGGLNMRDFPSRGGGGGGGRLNMRDFPRRLAFHKTYFEVAYLPKSMFQGSLK